MNIKVSRFFFSQPNDPIIELENNNSNNNQNYNWTREYITNHAPVVVKDKTTYKQYAFHKSIVQEKSIMMGWRKK